MDNVLKTMLDEGDHLISQTNKLSEKFSSLNLSNQVKNKFFDVLNREINNDRQMSVECVTLKFSNIAKEEKLDPNTIMQVNEFIKTFFKFAGVQ